MQLRLQNRLMIFLFDMGIEQIRNIKANGGKLPEKKIYWLPKVSKKRAALLAAQKETNGNEQLEKWFAKIAKQIAKNPVCQECGEKIHRDYFRHATAHLLPKKTFVSVASHPLNYAILGSHCGCHYKTHRFDQMQKMKIFSSVILPRLLMIEPDIAQSERKNLPQFLLDEIEKNNFLK
jgi:hypothetical protein